MPKTIPFRTRVQACFAWNTRYGKKPKKKPYRSRAKKDKLAKLQGGSGAALSAYELGREV